MISLEKKIGYYIMECQKDNCSVDHDPMKWVLPDDTNSPVLTIKDSVNILLLKDHH